jgi:glycosyltransferase involved in cell wall biosynthesis
MKFSVLMASYNNSKYIGGAIRSVINQSYKNWELIIVDDLSSDNSVGVIESFLKDARIKLFKHDKHVGCGATKRDCASNSCGDILGELDSDDALRLDALEVMVGAHAKDNRCGIISSSYYDCDKNLNVIERVEARESLEDKSNLHNFRARHFRTFKKNAYAKTSGYDPELLGAVDRDVAYKLEEVSGFCIVDEPLYYYRRHNPGISFPDKTLKAELNRYFVVISKYNAFKRRSKINTENLSRIEMSDILLGVIPSCLKMKDMKKARYISWESIKIAPFNIFGYFKLFFRLLKFVNKFLFHR